MSAMMEYVVCVCVCVVFCGVVNCDVWSYVVCGVQ